MKKRVLSMLLAFTLCFSTLPMTAFAQETEVVTEQEEQQEAVAAPENSHTVENMDTDGESSIVSANGESVSDSDAGEQNTGADAAKDPEVQAVQALIDALPEEVTEENADELQAQLAIIGEAMDTLTEEQIAALNMERYDAICDALMGLVAVQDETHSHYLCGGDTCNGVGGHKESNVVTFEAWNETDSLPEKAGCYYLTGNVELTETCVLRSTSSMEVVLCLNGHNITGVTEINDDINVWENVTFILCDCHDNGKITHKADVLGTGVLVRGTFAMYGGSICNNERLNGAGVSIERTTATFNMYGGDISNNKAIKEGNANGSGGGVIINGGTFNMYGGTISENSAETNGGGVLMSQAERAGDVVFNMFGGTISGNSADEYGGGVYMSTGGYRVGGTFTMTGGIIAGNTAGKCGGGVYHIETGTFQMSGTPVITNNKVNDTVNNVYLRSSAAPIQLTGELNNGARVGITPQKLPESTEDSAVKIATGEENYVQSALGKIVVDGGSGTGYGIVSNTENSVNYLAVEKLAPHEHPICGDNTCPDHVESVNWVPVSTEAELNAVQAGTELVPNYYYLLNDITLTDTWIPADNVVLCLNGKSIIADGDFNTITCRRTTFMLTDCASTAGKITHTSGSEGSGVVVVGNGNNNDSKGFIMYGGSIAGNTVTGNGGGVYIDNSQYNKFTMYGGSIIDNKASGNGGGVYSLNGDITMTGGTIAKNTAVAEGGGVHIGDGSTVVFEMTGGTITNNKANTNGGGVYVKTSYSYIHLSGEVNITGNTTGSKANNVYLSSNKTITVIGNLAADAQIGVTTEKTPGKGDFTKVAVGTTDHPLTEADRKCFTPDTGASYVIENLDDKFIIKNADDDTLHRHPICGKTCTHTDADGTPQHKDVYWEGVSALSNSMSDGYYYLTDNVTLTDSWQPASGVVLDLHGHDITLNANYRNVIEIDNAGTFTLTDCKSGSGAWGKITHGEGYTGGGGIGINSSYTTFAMYGGSITGNSGAQGVYLEGSEYHNRNKTFIMYGGEITNNNNTNTYSEGGGVYIGNYNAFTMIGGKISENRTVGFGGGVYATARSTFTMQGGSITDNTATKNGGGVYVCKTVNVTNDNFIVSGDVQITENKKKDDTTEYVDNVYLQTTYDENKQAYIKVNGALADTASIGVSAGTIDTGNYKVVAQGSNYTLTNGDLKHFSSDVAGYTPKLLDNSIAFANGDLHEHPICGKNGCNDGHSNTLWIPLTYDAENKTLKYGTNTAARTAASADGSDYYKYTLPAGSYYLPENIALNGMIDISGDVNICLNGNTISTDTSCEAVFCFAANKLTICDCRTAGKILVNDSKKNTDAVYLGTQASFDLYGGTISGGDHGVNGSGAVKLYGGTITKNDCGVYCVDDLSLTIGGDAKITDNWTKNVYLVSGKTIAIDNSLTKDANIGISTYPEPSADTNIKIATGGNSTALDYSQIFTPDVTEQNYVISQDAEGNLYLGIHQHSWKATANGAAITLKCDADGCNLADGFAVTYTVTAPDEADLVYSGSEKPATVEVSDNPTGLGLPAVSAVAITYMESDGTALEGAPIDAGTYQASITIGDKTASVTYTIVSKVVTNPAIEVSAAGTYDGNAKKPSVTVKDENKEIPASEYSVSYKNNTNAGTATVIITNANGGNYNVSGSETFTIGKATITVTPTAGQKTIYGIAERPLGYSSSRAVNGEDPAFAGTLSRAAGKDAGKYDITLGTLALSDNSAGNFRADNYELKLADTVVQFTIEPKTLTAEDLEFTTDSTFTKTYDKTTDCTSTTAKVGIKPGAKVNSNDEVPEVKGTYAYNSANVTEANKVIFTSEMTSNQNYTLPSGLTVEHEAEIEKAGQSPLFITSKAATYGTDLTLTVDGGSGYGEVTYTVVNGTEVAAITGNTLHPFKVGKVTVVATKSGDDNHYKATSGEATITIGKGDYAGEAKKVVNIMRNRSDVQSGFVNVADFFPEGQVPEGAKISEYKAGGMTMLSGMRLDDSSQRFEYTSVTDITGTEDQTCTVTITSTNYNDITATLTFHPTDKTTITLSGLTYTDKTYDGSAIQPTGTLQVTGGDVPVNELEVLYEGTSTNGTNYSNTAAPKDAGTYKVTYKVADDNENYTGSVEYDFTIFPKDVTADMIGTIADETYTGSAIKPEPAVMDDKVTLYSGTDFDFSYENNIKAGENTATVIITGKGNYTGTASKTFTIRPKDINGAEIVLTNSSFTYDGIKKTVEITSVTHDGKTLTSPKDYEIKEGNEFISVNDAITLTIVGKGNYTGTATTTWKITKATPTLGNFKVTPDLSTAQPYDGTPKTVTVQTNDAIGMGKVTVYYEGDSDTTYTRSEKAPVNAGTYKVILSVAEGTNYTAAEIEAGTMTINKAVLKAEDVTEFFEYTKTGRQTINVGSLVPGATGYTLDAYTDDNGILSGIITIDATGLMEFALSALTIGNVDNKVTVPVKITSENYEDVTVKVTIYISPEYRIIEGAGSSWTQNTGGTIVIRGNGAFVDFRKVKVDGKDIDPQYYTVTEGSTIITLKAEYLKTLAAGSHTFEIVWYNGIAGTNFTVAANNPGGNGNGNGSNDNDDNSGNDDANTTDTNAAGTDPAQEMDKVPATGDPFGIWLTLFAISLTGFAGMLVRKKKN